MKAKMYVGLLVGGMIFALTACGGYGSTAGTKAEETTVKETIAETTAKKETATEAETSVASDFVWPFGKIGKMLPIFEGKSGELSYEDNTSLSMDLYDVSASEFMDYASRCQEAGFNVDYSIRDTSYSALNAEGYDLYLSYTESKKEMWIKVTISEDALAAQSTEAETSTDETTETTSEVEVTTAAETTATETTASASSNDIRPEIKDAIDSYEDFFDEYCEFMKKYNDSPTSASMLADYTSYMAQCAETLDKLQTLQNSDLTTAELLYLNDATLRIYDKLSKAGIM